MIIRRVIDFILLTTILTACEPLAPGLTSTKLTIYSFAEYIM